MCVGTSCTWVTLWRSMAASRSSGSKCSITTAVPPRRCVPIVQPAGAAWYSGAGERYTVSRVKPKSPPSSRVRNDTAPRSVSTSGGRMPLGWPVVPEE